MWRLINRLRGRQQQRQHGATAIATALLLVVLLGFAAIAVDVGLLYAKRAELQNGADAAALAIAQTCAKGSCPANPGGVASSFGLLNSNGDAAQTATVVGPSANSVTVHVNKADGDAVQSIFSSFLGVEETDVGASATASWGSLMRSAAAFPLVFSNCQFDLSGAPQLMQSHKTNPGFECERGVSGLIIPGNFGWLQEDPGKCQATLNLNAAGYTSKGDVSPGNSGPKNCDSLMQDWASAINSGGKAVVLLPVYDDAGDPDNSEASKGPKGSGAYGRYHIRGFAAIEVLGWKFSGGDNSLPASFHNTSSTAPAGTSCTGDCRGIIGKFIKHVSLEEGSYLGGEDLGLRFARLTN